MKLFSKNSNLCDHNPPTLQTDGRTDRQRERHTDRQTTCDRNTALCTKVHRAVKIVFHTSSSKVDRFTSKPIDQRPVCTIVEYLSPAYMLRFLPARRTLVQSAVLRSHVVCLSVCHAPVLCQNEESYSGVISSPSGSPKTLVF